MKHYDVVIIGAGTSGLTARREVAKQTDNYIIVDDGILGTTCARVGCMPSKVLIEVANTYHQSKKMISKELFETQGLGNNKKKIMEHVRSLRDRFVRGVLSAMPAWEDKFIKARAKIVDDNTVLIGEELVKADKIIIATGSRPIVPNSWLPYKKFFMDTNSFFEQEELPDKVLVVGLGVIGLELGQALSRLGISVTGVNRGGFIGGLSDPLISGYAINKLSEEFPVFRNGVEFTGEPVGDQVCVMLDGKAHKFDQVLLAMGRTPNVDNIGLESLNIDLSNRGVPKYDLNTMALVEKPHIYLPGDVNADAPILHEAADEGKIAGRNAVSKEGNKKYKRRTHLGVTFSDPNIATAGERFSSIKARGVQFVTGKVSFEGQGRSIVKLKEHGLLHVYVDKNTAKILGVELQSPDGEHIAHLMAWAIQSELTVFEALKRPFYHPVIEEGLRTALRDAARQINPDFDELDQIS